MYSDLVTKKISQASAIRKFGFFKVLPIGKPCRLNAIFLTNRSSTIVCTSKIGNLSVQVGVPPGVGSGYGHSEVLEGGSESA